MELESLATHESDVWRRRKKTHDEIMRRQRIVVIMVERRRRNSTTPMQLHMGHHEHDLATMGPWVARTERSKSYSVPSRHYGAPNPERLDIFNFSRLVYLIKREGMQTV